MLSRDSLWQDLQFAARVLRGRRGFGLTAMITLGLAVGANMAIFTVIDRVLLNPLPYANADQLYAVFHHDTKTGLDDKASGAEVMDWRSRPGLFSNVGFSWDAQYTLTSASRPISLRAFQFSDGFFSMLGATPAIGRTLRAGDAAPGAEHVVVLSDHLWRTEFGGARDVLGRVLRLDDTAYTIVGVMPPAFAHPEAGIDLWAPLPMPPGLVDNRSLHVFTVVARMAPGVTAQQVRAALGSTAAIEPLRDVYVGPARTALWILQAALVFLLVVATANIANLSLAHATAVERETAIRLALGATGQRLASQFLTLGLMIAAIGFVIAITLAGYAIDAAPLIFARFFGSTPPMLADGVTPAAVAAAIAASALIGSTIGGIMLLSSRSGCIGALGYGSRSITASRRATRVRSAIVAAQLAISLVLLCSSGLLIRSVVNLEHRSLGVTTDDRLAFVLVPTGEYGSPGRIAMYVEQILDRLRAVPGVQAAAATSAIPLSGMDARRRLILGAARDSSTNGRDNVVHYRVISNEYFGDVGVPVRRGRPFDAADRSGSEAVAVVNETAVRARFGGETPIGRLVTIAGGPKPEVVRIVGVVGDVRHAGLASDPVPEIYRPLNQAYWPFFGIIVHIATDPSAMVKSAEAAVWAMNPRQPIDRVTTMASLASDSLALRRTSMLLLAAFAMAATLLAALGVYGVLAYVVRQRTREIGVRIALGAEPAHVAWQVTTSGVALAAIGCVAGAALTVLLTRYLRSLLFEVQPTDAWTLVSALAITIAIAAIASYLPARRAARVDPTVALRDGDL